MNRERMEHLVEVLERVDSAKYQQSTFGFFSRGDDLKRPSELFGAQPDDVLPMVLTDPFECHTSGCALGWAAFDPEFQKQGLHWLLLTQHEVLWKRLDNVINAAGSFEGFWAVTYRDLHYGQAAKEFFDLEDNQTSILFGSGGATVAQKIAQIEHFLEKNVAVHEANFTADGHYLPPVIKEFCERLDIQVRHVDDYVLWKNTVWRIAGFKVDPLGQWFAISNSGYWMPLHELENASA